MNDMFCPTCRIPLNIKSSQTFKYDPIVMVEEVTYFCSKCGFEQKVEYFKQLNEQT